jgi:hypothetical protein
MTAINSSHPVYELSFITFTYYKTGTKAHT